MSFQIPGLGQAKPNEALPPLPNEDTAAESKAEENEQSKEQTDGNNGHTSADTANDNTDHKGPDPMAIDQPENPPSLTGALEAALGGLVSRPQPETSTELQPDQSENPEWEIDSSPYESSSDSSSSDSSDSDSEDGEKYEPLSVEETARILMETEGGGGSDDEGGDRAGKASSGTQMRTKNEMPNEVVPKPDITITPDMKIEELGVIEQLVDNIALIKAFTPGEYQVLDSGSVLCTEDRTVVGAVAETIGKVLQPMYTLYFTSGEEAAQLGVQTGTKLFYSVDHASFVFTEPLKNMKGSDASNLHDEEIGDEEMEFSDDEKEMEHKRSLKQKKKDRFKAKTSNAGPHPLSREVPADGGLNYDDNDDEDGPYKPLTRPPGFGNGPVSNELPPRAGASRNNKRGGNRGRGSFRGGRGGARDGYSPPAQQQSPQASQPPPPAVPNFPFQLPAGWQPPPPPPPPGWNPQGQGQAGVSNTYVDPALVAALMRQMQAQSGQWPQQPPNGQGR